MRKTIAAAVLAAVALSWAPQAAAAVTFNVQGTLRYTDTFGDPTDVSDLASALDISLPVDYSFTMVLLEDPNWPAQSFDLQVGDRHWSGTSSDWAYGYLSAFDDGVFFNVGFDAFEPDLGETLRITFGASFQQMSLLRDSPSNDPADYLNAGRSYVNFIAGVPGVSTIAMRSNLPSLTGPNDPVTSVSIDGAFVPRPEVIVPEPGAWALLVLGFMGMGSALRYRRSVAEPADL